VGEVEAEADADAKVDKDPCESEEYDDLDLSEWLELTEMDDAVEASRRC